MGLWTLDWTYAYMWGNNWASVSEPHTSVFNCKFVCAYGVRTYVRTYAHTAYCFAFQYNVSNSLAISHIGTAESEF